MSTLFSEPLAFHQYETDNIIRGTIQKAEEKELITPVFAKKLYKAHAINMTQLESIKILKIKGQPIEERESGDSVSYFLSYIIDFEGLVALFTFQPKLWMPLNQKMEIKGSKVELIYELPPDKNMDRARIQVRQDIKKIKTNIQNLKEEILAYNNEIKKVIDEEIQLKKYKIENG
jgi:hypothetical protein